MEKSNKDYIYECENGKVYGIPYNQKCCLICKHCTDIWYDYTNGPYMFFCGLDSEYANEMSNKAGDECECFVLNENTLTVEEYEEKIKSPEYIEEQKAIQEAVNKLLNDKKFEEAMKKAIFMAPIINAMPRNLNFLKSIIKEDK